MTALFFALLGTLAGAVLSLVPALHIYNVAGILLLLVLRGEGMLTGEQFPFFCLGLVAAYSVLNSIPSIFFTTPDDSTAFITLPAQKYLLESQGYQAAVLTGLGGLGGFLFLAALTPIATRWLPVLRIILQPHLGWILLAVVLFMLMSEWPRGGDVKGGAWKRLWFAWRGLLAGLMVFFLSGVLGFVLMYRNLVPAEFAYQSLWPAFTGLFAVPWLLLNLAARTQIPRQTISRATGLTPGQWLRGSAAGAAGGLFAAFFPVVTGGIGALLAGHATAQRDDRLFLVGQGANKVVYYVGAYLFFFMPGLHLTRGGLAWMAGSVYTAYTPQVYLEAAAAAAICGALSLLLLIPAAQLAARFVGRVDTRWLSLAALVVLVGLVFALTGWSGLAVLLVASGIGLIPPLWGTRRMNCMGILLLPVTLNMLGVGAAVARWLGLA